MATDLFEELMQMRTTKFTGNPQVNTLLFPLYVSIRHKFMKRSM